MNITRDQLDQLQCILVNEHCRYEKLARTEKENTLISIFASFPYWAIKEIQKMDGYIAVEDYHLKEGLIEDEIGCIGNIRFKCGASEGTFQIILKCDCGLIPEVKLFLLKELSCEGKK